MTAVFRCGAAPRAGEGQDGFYPAWLDAGERVGARLGGGGDARYRRIRCVTAGAHDHQVSSARVALRLHRSGAPPPPGDAEPRPSSRRRGSSWIAYPQGVERPAPRVSDDWHACGTCCGPVLRFTRCLRKDSAVRQQDKCQADTCHAPQSRLKVRQERLCKDRLADAVREKKGQWLYRGFDDAVEATGLARVPAQRSRRGAYLRCRQPPTALPAPRAKGVAARCLRAHSARQTGLAAI